MDRARRTRCVERVWHRANVLGHDGRSVAKRLQRTFSVVDRSRPTGYEREHRLAVPFFRDERQRRSDLPCRESSKPPAHLE